jgi:SAM-dependent methyltransferase
VNYSSLVHAMFGTLKTMMRSVVPAPVLHWRRRRRIAVIRRRNAGRSVGEIFADIYRQNSWGGDKGTFHSGSGSTFQHAQLYADAVRKFSLRHGVRRVVDLGCGDFQIGSQIIGTDIEYVGVDIVPELIARNQQSYGSDRVRFCCRNIIEDALPEADLCLVRQVLQHFSNEQIAGVLRNIAGYRYVLVTEHYPADGSPVAANVEKPCGEDVRIYDDSAVYLDAPPFNLSIEGPILDVDAGSYLVRRGERIRTYLIRGGGKPDEHKS